MTLKDPESWPDDPLYGYATSAQPGERVSGQWPLYSFVPNRSPDAPFVRPSEVSAGMSVDLAWRHGLGNPRIVIAVLGTGIRWDQSDLNQNVRLNAGELARQPPLHRDGTPCSPLDPDQPNAPLLDCNGDGVFDIRDYADHPFLPSGDAQDDGEQVSGDRNGNGLLDAGDLIENPLFSNGVDDDNNGFVDDIAGWDFTDDDNNPEESWGQVQGTLHASLAVAQANNGIERAGVCPKCRYLPIRTGVLNTSMPDRLALAIDYAADQGARVILATTDAVGHSRFLQSALDYAYRRGSLVITSTEDHNSFRHSPLTIQNHVLTVSGIALLGSDQQSTSATSFMAFNTCGGYGPQVSLSASSAGCAREGAATVGGIAGLVLSSSLEAGFDLEQGSTSFLTAAETRLLLVNGTDDVNIEESSAPESPHFYSKPGFDQRFGYGRVHADRPIQTIQLKKPPPQVDIRSPRWFESFAVEQVTAPIKVLGTVSAPRATTYQFTVEWAPGVQPKDDEFSVISMSEEIPGTTVSGSETEALAEFDVRNVSMSSQPNQDGPLGESSSAITLRVRATAEYTAGAEGTRSLISGEARRTIYVYNETGLLPGFPRYLGATSYAGPKLADIDGDGVRDIVVATMGGEVHVLRAVGTVEPIVGFPFGTRRLSELSTAVEGAPSHAQAAAYQDLTGQGAPVSLALAREPIFGAPALSDLNHDGATDIVVVSVQGTVYGIKHDGTALTGFPVELPALPSCSDPDIGEDAACRNESDRVLPGTLASPVLADIDVDEDLELIIAGLDGQIHALEVNGSPSEGYPLMADAEQPRAITTTPVLADFDGDRVLDLLVGAHERLGSSGSGARFTLLHGSGSRRGMAFSNWPVTAKAQRLSPLIGEGAAATGVAADIDADGTAEAIFHGNGAQVFILPSDPGEQASTGALPDNALPKADPDEGSGSGLDHTSVGAASTVGTRVNFMAWAGQVEASDLDQDGTLDIIAAGGENKLLSDFGKVLPKSEPGRHLLAMFDGETGRAFPSSPIVLEETPAGNGFAIADVSGDSYPEVIVGTAGLKLHAIDACGREAEGFPKFTGQWISGTPAIGDIDGDDRLEVVVTTRDGWLFAYKTRGRSDGVITWESAHHDNRNTSDLQVQLEQGQLPEEVEPLSFGPDGKCLESLEPGPTQAPVYRPRGGCAYRSSPQPAGTSIWLWIAAWLSVTCARAARNRRLCA